MEIAEDDVLHVCYRALDGMARILTELGDELANTRPPLHHASTPVQIVTHCLGVLEYWVGQGVAGRTIERDREAELGAQGLVAPLVARVYDAHVRLAHDLADADLTAPANIERGHPSLDLIATRGAALMHAVEDLAQHHGQLELARDALLAGAPER
ncbi:mycothiol transferase [Actinotalea fermentans]|uniref:DUF664 domain-containing protein n=1 Tax=Actinotalea fermentans TaxID=43671 RepID=A0A511Z137_9CELL|nr:DUF664 domain-containing protein [Actinotalea fermentans]GEN81152.1 hypothetical protein AFE02nite_28860 [Actinotalea fermentans]